MKGFEVPKMAFRLGKFIFFREGRNWSDRRWANTPKWLFGVESWVFDSLGWGNLHCGWFLNPRLLTVGISWEIISDNWIGTRNELLVRVHPLPMLVLYASFAIPERWVAREIGTSQIVTGHFRR